MTYNIFISYAHSFSWEAREIQKDLEGRGAEAFLDILAIDFGDNFEKTILSNLSKCDELWVLFTPTMQSIEPSKLIHGSVDRPYVWLETGVAWHRGIPVVPLLNKISKKEMEANEKIPVFIKTKQAIELSNTESYEQLLRSVEEKVARAKGCQKRVNRLLLELPLKIRCENDPVCRSAFLSQLSEDGSGCFIATQDTFGINENIECFFNAKIIHKTPTKHDQRHIAGIGAKIFN